MRNLDFSSYFRIEINLRLSHKLFVKWSVSLHRMLLARLIYYKISLDTSRWVYLYGKTYTVSLLRMLVRILWSMNSFTSLVIRRQIGGSVSVFVEVFSWLTLFVYTGCVFLTSVTNSHTCCWRQLPVILSLNQIELTLNIWCDKVSVITATMNKVIA